jgi:hypothetical protein
MHQIAEVQGSVIKSTINVMGKNTQQQSSQFLSLLPMQAALQTFKTSRVNKQGFTSLQSMQVSGFSSEVFLSFTIIIGFGCLSTMSMFSDDIFV